VLPHGPPGRRYGAPVEVGSGAWCWFADPRAVVVDGVTHVGWIDCAGAVRVAAVAGDLATTATLHAGLGVDDHDNPALLARADGRLQAFYSAHGGPQMLFRIADERGRWGPEQSLATNTPGRRGYTYPNPVQLAGEGGQIHLFWRGGDFNPAFSTSPDGVRWTPAATLIRAPGQRPYVKIATDGRETIATAFTDGHPRETATSLYFARYAGGGWFTAGGRRIAGPPFAPAAADRVWDAAARGRRAWVHDVALGADGHPRILYAVFVSPTDHRYRHARWTGAVWDDHEITPAGGFFPDEPREREYSGGLAFDHAQPSVAYLSRAVDGQWQVERWATPDGGVTWTHRSLTEGSRERNVRPVVARNGGPLWMRGTYAHYTRYRTAIVTA